MVKNQSNQKNYIEVAESEHTAYIKIHGKATFKLAPDFKDFVEWEMNRDVRGVLVDLYECETLDSTFIGTITSLTLKYKKGKKSRIRLFNVNKHILSILKNLGLLNILDIFEMDSDKLPEFSVVNHKGKSKVEITNLMLDAHETLASLNEKNASEFKSVVEMLRKSLK